MKKSKTKAFTLIELLLGLMISGIILTAVVTLAYAMSSAYDQTSDVNEKESYIRYTTLKISDLIKNSLLVCRATSDELTIWRADDNNDNKINISEIMYIETGGGNYLRLLQFNPPAESDTNPALSSINKYYYKQWLLYLYPNQYRTYTTLISECTNMKIMIDRNPPYTKLVKISFDIEENQQVRKCQIISSLRCLKSEFINTYGNIISSDDDL